MWKLTVCALLAAVFAAPSYAASLVGRDDVEAVPTLWRRQARSLPYGGGSVDSLNHVGPLGPVDAYLDQTEAPPEDDSSEEDLGDVVAKMEQVKKDLTIDFSRREEMVAELQELIAAMEKLPPPPTPAPVNPAEAQEQQQAQQSQQEQQQADPAQTQEQAAEAAEQAATQADASRPPDPPSPSGPDGSNKEDGDGDGNNNNNAADPPSPPENNNNNNGGGDAGEGQHDSGAGAPDAPSPPATPEPVPYEHLQNGHDNSIDHGNEDTKS